MWDKINPAVSALIGGLLGSALTVATVGWAEAEKLAQTDRARALAEFAEAAWGPNRLEYDRKVSALTVYASPDVIRTHAAWVQRHCNETQRSKAPDCQDAWADVIVAMRRDSGVQPVEKRYIIDAIWEKTKS
jgi:hypothetical protein